MYPEKSGSPLSQHGGADCGPEKGTDVPGRGFCPDREPGRGDGDPYRDLQGTQGNQ